MGKDIYSRVKYPKGQRSVGQVRMGTDVRGIGVKRESTHVAVATLKPENFFWLSTKISTSDDACVLLI